MSEPKTIEERRREGAEVRREVLGAAYVDKGKNPDPFNKHFLDFTIDHCWGNVWLRPGLERRTRSMLNIAMLAVLARWAELEAHTRGALNNGVSEDEIAEILLQAGVYAGVPVAAEGFRSAFRAIEAWRQSAKR
jgi:4-carboxymuconolactone decarboxylase